MSVNHKARRLLALLIIAIASLSALAYDVARHEFGAGEKVAQPTQAPQQNLQESVQLATDELAQLPVKGKAPKTGYKRTQFSSGWAKSGGCDLRNIILRRDLKDAKVNEDCKVLSGTLNDPYTGKTIEFVRGPDTSDKVQIDHVVALSNAWQTGAQQITAEQRHALANDPLNLVAVDGAANQKKSDSDAASWLPSNKSFRCQYVARQIAVKRAYELWVTTTELATMQRVLESCPRQGMPIQ